MFPDDATLLARGKYATLSRARREQIERAQGVCTAMMSQLHHALADCQAKPPGNTIPIATLEKCLANLQEARVKLVELSTQMIELHDEAWPQ